MFSLKNSILVINTVFFLYKTGESMMDATIRPYLIRAVCHKFLKDIKIEDETICSSLDEYPELEDDIQKQSRYYLMYYRILLNVPAIVLSICCGSYSDKYGRKLVVLFPCFGSIFAVMLYMTSNIVPTYRIPLIVGGAAMQGICGKSSIITMTINSLVFDLSDEKNRTRHFGLLLAINFLGGSLGALISGLFQDVLDLNAVFASIMVSYILALILTLTLLNDNEKKTDKTDEKSCSLFQIQHIKETIAVIAKPRSGNNRTVLITLIIMSVVNQMCKVGEADVKIMFVTRSPLSWSESWFGYLLSSEYAIMGVSLLLFTPLFTNKLELSDGKILTIGLLSNASKLIFLSFSTKSWMIFVSVGIGTFTGMIGASVRSLLSKTVSEEEVGKMFAILSGGETIAKFLGTTAFVNIYSETAHIFRGMAFLIGAFLYFSILVVSVLVVFNRRQNLQQSSTDHETVYRSDTLKAEDQGDQIHAQVSSMTYPSSPQLSALDISVYITIPEQSKMYK